MKRSVLLLMTLASTLAYADRNNPMETVEQARQRQSTENYETYRRQDNQLLPPSYQQPLGSPSVYGVERPGYVSPSPSYQPQPSYQQPYGSGDWRRGLR
jgi:hypothetical protein